ncbi:hypothetical protein TNCV_4652501 [Trichonephila clavipes]|nr:hypothetical protein TNCV_4652501 [Trichonephila clavipes]
MSTKLAWVQNTGASRQTDHLTGTSVHAPECPRSVILNLFITADRSTHHALQQVLLYDVAWSQTDFECLLEEEEFHIACMRSKSSSFEGADHEHADQPNPTRAQ